MASIELLAKYGVSLDKAMSPETLPVLREKYVALVDSLRSDSESETTESDSLLKQLSDSVANVETVKATVSELRSSLTQQVLDAIDANPSIVIPLVEALQEVKTTAMNERDYHVSVVKRQLQPRKVVVDSDFMDRRQEAEDLAELIRNLFTLLKGSVKHSKAFPLKEQQAKGEDGNRHGTGTFIPDIPNLPRIPGDGSVAVGRNASHRQMRFAWNGEDIPAGTFVTDVAHDYVSDRRTGFIVDQRGIVDAVEKLGHKFADENGWEVKFPTGTLRGWLPKKES